ncbi:MAG TPA: hypothetical protein VMI54_00425 [Polyangiaceae bacterium]|nr:hypothetical protein [Polyangiaceae bacterium]
MGRKRALFGAARVVLTLVAVAALGCSSKKPGDDDDDSCYPDNDGVTDDRPYTFDLTVDDAGFSKSLLNTQNSSPVTLTLQNNGTVPHGFEVDCVDVTSAYPDLPAGCSSMGCFPPESMIAPLDPGASATIMFVTPVPDNLIYPFKSSSPDDASVPGLNDGQWSLM